MPLRFLARADPMGPLNPLVEEALRLHRSGERAQAAELYRQVLRAEPQNFEALFFLGVLHGEEGRFEEAQHFTGEAANANPQSADAFFLRSYALQQLGRYEDALLCLNRTLTLNPLLKQALLNRVSLLFRLRRYEDAAGDCKRLLTLDPDYPFVRGNLLFAQLQCCDWSDLAAEKSAILSALAAGQRVIAPFQAKALGVSPQAELSCAKIWSADQVPKLPPLWRGEAYRHDKIRVAYVSADFHAHAMANLAAGVFEHHDRQRFETIAISFGPDDKSDMRARLTRAFDYFIDVRDMSDAAIAMRLREMETDIAVDLMGFTESARPAIFAARPAPVQVSYLGFAGTTGSGHLDYLIADAVVAPATEHLHYSEKIVTLPGTFMPADATRAISKRGVARAEEGLPEDAFVFCCFNAPYKINSEIFAVWMRLLIRTPQAVLWLGQINAAAQRNLVRAAQGHGVSADRLIFAAPRPDPAEHLARLGLADLFLDTLPYNAHATSSDALWAGLPVLTCRGDAFAGRVAASMLKAAGLPELIAASVEEYEARASELARNPGLLAALKAKLAQARTSALFDTAAYTRRLERAYVTMWQKSQCGQPPTAFEVPD